MKKPKKTPKNKKNKKIKKDNNKIKSETFGSLG